LNHQFVPYLFDTKISHCSENGISQTTAPECDYVDVSILIVTEQYEIDMSTSRLQFTVFALLA
jgi:hypothetical protein